MNGSERGKLDEEQALFEEKRSRFEDLRATLEAGKAGRLDHEVLGDLGLELLRQDERVWTESWRRYGVRGEGALSTSDARHFERLVRYHLFKAEDMKLKNKFVRSYEWSRAKDFYDTMKSLTEPSS